MLIARSPVCSRLFPLAAALPLLWVLPAGAQDSCDLKIRRAVGDRHLVTIESTVDSTITTTDPDGNEASRSFSTVRKDSFVEEILAVDDAQAPTQVRLNCRASTVEEGAAGEASGGVRRTGLHGKILTVTREGDAVTAAIVGGEALPADLAAPLGRWHDLRFLLKDSAKAGEAWDARGADRVCALLLGAGTAAPAVKCTLRDVAKGPPDKAEVAVNVVVNSAEADRRIQGNLDGTLTLDLTAGRPLSLVLGGSIDASQNIRDTQGQSVGKAEIRVRKIEYKLTFEPVQ